MKWKTLQQNGILFPPAFESQGIKLKIKGEKVPLNLLQEEMIYQWAKKKDTPYGQDKIFQKNFVADFAKTLPSKFKKISYSDIDFLAANKVVDKEKDAKEARPARRWRCREQSRGESCAEWVTFTRTWRTARFSTTSWPRSIPVESSTKTRTASHRRRSSSR